MNILFGSLEKSNNKPCVIPRYTGDGIGRYKMDDGYSHSVDSENE